MHCIVPLSLDGRGIKGEGVGDAQHHPKLEACLVLDTRINPQGGRHSGLDPESRDEVAARTVIPHALHCHSPRKREPITKTQLERATVCTRYLSVAEFCKVLQLSACFPIMRRAR